jgi:hypothetical protein
MGSKGPKLQRLRRASMGGLSIAALAIAIIFVPARRTDNFARTTTMSFVSRLLVVCFGTSLIGCAMTPLSERDSAHSANEHKVAQPVRLIWADAVVWHHKPFPGKRPSEYRRVRHEGRDAVLVHAEGSVSMLRKSVHVAPAELGRLRFSWQVPSLIDAANLASREHDDSPVRVVLAFEGDRSVFSAKDAMLSELSTALTGEPMPYATLMYVWSNQSPSDAVIPNPRTDRIRKIVVESGTQRLGQWQTYERDVRADFERAFGEAPGNLVGIGIMTDSDNTKSVTRAWYGPVVWVAKQP